MSPLPFPNKLGIRKSQPHAGRLVTKPSDLAGPDAESCSVDDGDGDGDDDDDDDFADSAVAAEKAHKVTYESPLGHSKKKKKKHTSKR